MDQLNHLAVITYGLAALFMPPTVQLVYAPFALYLIWHTHKQSTQ